MYLGFVFYLFLFIYFIYIPPHSQSSLGGLQRLKAINIKTNIQNFKTRKSFKNINIHIKTTILFLGSAKNTLNTC